MKLFKAYIRGAMRVPRECKLSLAPVNICFVYTLSLLSQEKANLSKVMTLYHQTKDQCVACDMNDVDLLGVKPNCSGLVW